ncbi:hypothetical protein XENORESO_021453 [Xenotaenia resolanae]|uniref:Uncharacterized protein n=1 Tax=Xenotaenia resolanae TaxID=208358 RepID=A0ABV0VXU1_9TELE
MSVNKSRQREFLPLPVSHQNCGLIKLLSSCLLSSSFKINQTSFLPEHNYLSAGDKGDVCDDDPTAGVPQTLKIKPPEVQASFYFNKFSLQLRLLGDSCYAEVR